MLLDRGRGSTEVYQYGVRREMRKVIWEEYVRHKPHYQYVLDTDVEILLERRNKREILSDFDKDTYSEYQLRRTRYLEWAYSQPRMSILDANAEIDVLVKVVMHQINMQRNMGSFR